eukprot:GHVP01001082.1.p1 GENE.GHVP01001082.1~~GHVP01001082.1.p1  ORF type:complete len:448 (-),score=74.16 GHVP01001082.1:1377-2720(-)
MRFLRLIKKRENVPFCAVEENSTSRWISVFNVHTFSTKSPSPKDVTDDLNYLEGNVLNIYFVCEPPGCLLFLEFKDAYEAQSFMNGSERSKFLIQCRNLFCGHPPTFCYVRQVIIRTPVAAKVCGDPTFISSLENGNYSTLHVIDQNLSCSLGKEIIKYSPDPRKWEFFEKGISQEIQLGTRFANVALEGSTKLASIFSDQYKCEIHHLETILQNILSTPGWETFSPDQVSVRRISTDVEVPFTDTLDLCKRIVVCSVFGKTPLILVSNEDLDNPTTQDRILLEEGHCLFLPENSSKIFGVKTGKKIRTDNQVLNRDKLTFLLVFRELVSIENRRLLSPWNIRSFEREPNCALDVEISKVSDLDNFQKEFVHATYACIAEHFSLTRYRPWPEVSQFINSCPAGSTFLDIGCGNAKYKSVAQERNLFYLGTDACLELMQSIMRKGNVH